MNESDLDPSTSPLAAFGTQLRRSRKARGLSQAELGRKIFCTGTYVSYIERAKRDPSHNFAVRADAALETGGTLELMWWHLKNTALLEGFAEFAEHESKAAEIRIFELGVIPGLFQTEAYATADASGALQRGSITQHQADERVAFLATRQRLLERDPAPLVHAVLDESCLHSEVGGVAVMDGQLERLELLSRRPNVIIQIAPFKLGERRPFVMPVTLLTLRDVTVLGYTETLQRGYLERDIQSVMAWRRNYDRLQVEALSQADSVAMIREVRKELT
ncbi:helix-turn-helix domain-containing protein [Kitasatospora sp. NPDC001175]|uniref:helix-turn-helix domain-containing protein n=1 Tax=Kitasatospora sp. NPDC001175 TaxID=3157103 RepID=UPI003CFE3003